jgi:hypothetical protein
MMSSRSTKGVPAPRFDDLGVFSLTGRALEDAMQDVECLHRQY